MATCEEFAEKDGNEKGEESRRLEREMIYFHVGGRAKINE